MDILLKQRIIGAIVLISLAVIFIPMLLSGKSDLLSKHLNSNIPPKPSYEIKRPENVKFEKPAQPSFERPESDEVKQQPILDADKLIPEVKKPANTPALEDRKEPAEQIAVKTPPEQLSSESQAIPPDTLANTNNAQNNKENKQLATSWVVQVGSFSKEKNAIALRDKIQKSGISSFVSEAESSNGKVYRVRVGPELKRSLADDLRKTLQKKYKLNGIVIRYP